MRPSTTTGRYRHRRRTAGLALAAASVIGVLFGALTFRWFVRPPDETPATADAIVVLAGGRGERLERALELVRAGVAPSVVVNLGGQRWQGQDTLEALCADPPAGIELECIVAEPDSTRGEALTISRLARERGWESLAVVTSDYHVHRAALWFRRCHEGQITPVAARTRPRAQHVVHEWLGTIHATIAERSC